MRKICNRLFLALFGLALAAVPAFTLTRPEKKISYYENRALAEKPALTGENVRTGKYFPVGIPGSATTSWDATPF